MMGGNNGRSSNHKLLIGLVLLALCGGMLSGCLKKEPIRIGFVGELTGRQAELSVQGRNGALLALERINATGGVAGRPLELVIRDDMGTEAGAQQADRDLISSGVVVIIGHSTSSQTLAGLTVTEPAGILMFSGTTSTADLSGREDHFYRMIQTLLDRAKGMAHHIYQKRGITRVAAIYDVDNSAYTRSYLQTFKAEYLALGGQVEEAAFSSAGQKDFGPLLTALRDGRVDGLMLISSDIDAAMIAQRTRVLGWTVPLFGSAWAQTEMLLNNGGQAIEGMELEQTFPINSQAPAFLEFKQRYLARFGNPPSFGAALNYEAVQVLAAALNNTGGRKEGLEPALTGIRDFPGLVDKISLDRFGDAVRPHYMTVIRDGKFAGLDAIQPAGVVR